MTKTTILFVIYTTGLVKINLAWRVTCIPIITISGIEEMAFRRRQRNDSHWIYMLLYICKDVSKGGGVRGVIVFVVGNEHGDTSSNPVRDWLHFT